MKLATFKKSGKVSFGIVLDQGIIDLTDEWPEVRGLRDMLSDDWLVAARRIAASRKPDVQLSAVEFLPPIPDPDKLICIGKNYSSHVAEAGADLPTDPSLFLRLPNTMVAHGGALIKPLASDWFDYEGELTLVIGKGGRHIKPEHAFEHIAGYTCFNDASLRDIQRNHSLTAGKNFYATGGCGPWIVTADEIADVKSVQLETRLNGKVMQHSTLDKLIFDIPTLIAYISAFTPLVAGDLIATGTPEGVGASRKPPVWMKDGDVVEVDIAGVGVLRNPVRAEQA